jgi:hypothetical protein
MTYVFLSHSHKDRELAHKIARALTEENINIWFDEWEILVGDSIAQLVQQGLNEVDFVVLLLTANSIKSGWVEKEWQSQIGVEAERKNIRILPVKADDCDIPFLLRDKRYADIQTDYKKGISELIRGIQGHSERLSKPISFIPQEFPLKREKIFRPHLSVYILIVCIILIFAGVGFYIWNTVNHDKIYEFSENDSEDIFSTLPEVVPPAESYRIHAVDQLPSPDFSKFEISEEKMVVDLRRWKPFENGSEERVSPVTWNRKIRLKKIAKVDDIRFGFATEGAGIDATCLSGQDFRIETGTRLRTLPKF